MPPSSAGHPPAIRRVAIVGGGFSGALQAINLLRNGGPEAVLIERRPEVGRGVAYSAADPGLLLNVRSGNMSALPDEPDHFRQWLARCGQPSDGFVPRVVYGAYLAELLHTTQATAPDRLEVVQGEAVRAEVMADGIAVDLTDGRTIRADALVLAIGNLPPTPPDHLDPEAMPPGTYAPDPWQPSIVEGLTGDDVVLIVGTGLTMVDAALHLENSGYRGRIVALSRRGLAPRAHAGGGVAGGLGERPPIEVTGLLREVRARASEIGWRAAVDELRPYTRGMWLAAPDEQKARFLRHLRPWWEVHRHRIAPAVAERLQRMREEGRLRIVAGRTLGFTPSPEGAIDVTWRPRGGDAIDNLRVRRVINCSGPRIEMTRTTEPLLKQLRDAGLITSDTSGLGLAVDAQSRVIGADGAPHPRLFALGPMTRGTFWEITAVPDIRVQTWELARRFSNTHWVAGEGL
jgi:uncharacterized NAD(P)/FAD-binding protein YdhS